MSSFTRIDEIGSLTGKFYGFFRQILENKQTGEKQIYPGITLIDKDGRIHNLLLFHTAILNQFKSAAPLFVKDKTEIKVEYLGKVEGRGKGDFYHNYQIFLDGKLYLPDFDEITGDDFIQTF